MLGIELFVKKEMIERLKNLEGECIYLADLSFKVLESEYNNKSYTCNTYESITWIKQFFEELDEIIENYDNEYGKGSMPNPILNPEKFQLMIICYIADYLITDAIYNASLEIDEEIILTKDIINKIIEVL